MITSLREDDKHKKITILMGERLKGLIKFAIKEGKYKNQQDFFDKVYIRYSKSKEKETSYGNQSLKIVDINNPNTYNKYLNGSTTMKMDVLKQICIELNCTSDYLLGLSNINRNFYGSAYMIVNDMGYKIESNPTNEDEICIQFENEKIITTYDNFKNDIEILFGYYLYSKTH